MDASAFNLSGLESLRLGSVGGLIGASVNEFSTDGTLSQNSNTKVPTQNAVKTYVDGKFSALNGSNITSGTVPVARIGTGTKNNTTFYRGDGTFQVVSTDLVGDSSPQLGGDLDTNSFEILLDDLHAVKFGDSADLSIFHQSGFNQIQSNNTSPIQIRDASNVMLRADPGGAVDLRHNGSVRLATRASGTQVTGTVLAGSSAFASENSTYVIQAAAPAQAYISAYCGNTGTNLSNHGFHFGMDNTSHNIIGRENKSMRFYTNNAHACTIDTNQHYVPAGNNSKD